MYLFSVSTLLFGVALAAGPAEWRSRSIYQVLTDRFARPDSSTSAPCKTADRLYCGGTWTGLINHLDYIQGMGFDAVWISPITAQVQGKTAYGEAYHGYWQQSINDLNNHFGTSSDLQALSTALHARGMYLMVDVVVNHFASNSNPFSVDYAQMNPFSSASQYHPYCSIDYANIGNMTQLEVCWMGDQTVSLPDLRTESADVAATWSQWISGMVQTYGFDGLRLDSVIEVNTDFWSGFLAAANVYAVAEVYNGGVDFVCSYQAHVPGVMNYATYFPLVDAFKSTAGNIPALTSAINAVKGSCSDTSLLGSFSENHDQPRFASLTGDMALARNMLAYTMLADGIPIVYQGQEQHYNALGGSNDPYNREALWFSGYNTGSPLYVLTARLNAIRKNAIAVDASHLEYRNWPVWSNQHTLAMRKGNMLTVLTNTGSQSANSTLTISSSYYPGTLVTELFTCTQSLVQGDGSLQVRMSKGLPKVFYPTAGIGGLCNTKKRGIRFQA